MVGITERNKQKLELANRGFSLRYIDEWQPKTTLYRHKASYNPQGEILMDVGTSAKGVPGNPDYVLRKAQIGLFPWKPNESCECQCCQETDWEEKEPEMVQGFCDVCGVEVEARNNAGVSSKLTFHKRANHPDV